MKLTKLHLIIILALAIIICPVLGVCQNTREGFEDLNEEMAMRNDERDKDDEGDEHDVTFRE